MARKDWYTVRENPNGLDYDVIKVNEDLIPYGTYHVGRKGGSDGSAAMCDCFAGALFCRHKKMVSFFKAEEAINSGRLYNFDKNVWYTPPSEE